MKLLRRIVVGLVGGSVLLVGIAMIVLPGPAIIVIPAGLAILALEFAWARLWLRKVRKLLPISGKKEKKRDPGPGPDASGAETTKPPPPSPPEPR